MVRRSVVVMGLLVLIAIVVVVLLYGGQPAEHHSFPSDCGQFGTWTQLDSASNTVTWTGTKVCT